MHRASGDHHLYLPSFSGVMAAEWFYGHTEVSFQILCVCVHSEFPLQCRRFTPFHSHWESTKISEVTPYDSLPHQSMLGLKNMHWGVKTSASLPFHPQGSSWNMWAITQKKMKVQLSQRMEFTTHMRTTSETTVWSFCCAEWKKVTFCQEL